MRSVQDAKDPPPARSTLYLRAEPLSHFMQINTAYTNESNGSPSALLMNDGGGLVFFSLKDTSTSTSTGWYAGNAR